jgi:uncharacterized protein (DUF1684 family)
MKQTIYIALALLLACPVIAQKNINYKQSIENWHASRIEDLKKPNGWLNLEGLFWLHKGVNSFGSQKDKDCFYDNPNFPAYLGDFILEGETVKWVNKIKEGAAINTIVTPMGDTSIAFSFASEKEQPSSFNYAKFKWVVIKREDKIGIRFRNLEAPTLLNFKGIERFPVDEKWHIKATLETPAENFVMITNIIGQTAAQKKAGVLHFKINNQPFTLDVIDEGGPKYFITFADLTAGKTTYGAGRFIEIDKPDANGNTFIDFNLAYNPPCAFTAFATCPLPPPQNRLAIEIPAGEKKYGHH